MRLLVAYLLASCLSFTNAIAQTQPAASAPAASSYAPSHPLDPKQFSFLVGTWQGKGVFGGSGKPVSSTMVVAMPNSKTIEIHEKEDAPNTYQYIGLWSLEKVTDRLTMLMSSSLDGPAVYHSHGWQDDRLVFEPDGAVGTGATGVRWTYIRLSPDRLEVVYEYSVQGTWNLGDRQTFDRVQ